MDHHYFASNAFCWATAPTKKEAVEKAVRARGLKAVREGIKNAHRNGSAGFYIWSCRVECSPDAGYSIEYFSPKDVPISEGVHNHITHITKTEISGCSGDMTTGL